MGERLAEKKRKIFSDLFTFITILKSEVSMRSFFGSPSRMHTLMAFTVLMHAIRG